MSSTKWVQHLNGEFALTTHSNHKGIAKPDYNNLQICNEK